MFRFLFRILGLLLLAAGFVGAVIDGARSIANSSVLFTPLSEVGSRVLGDRYLLIQPGLERHVHPLLWDPVVLNLTRAPAALVAFGLGAILLWLARPRREPIGYRSGR